MPLYDQLSDSDKKVALRLKKVGFTPTEIGKSLGFHRSTISRFFKRFETTNDVARVKGSGRPRISTEKQDKTLERLSLKDRFESCSSLKTKWMRATCVSASARTVNRRLLDADLPARKPRKKPLKTETIKEKRLRFAQKYARWTIDDWKRVVFSDESWFQLFENGRRQFVRRRSGEAFLPLCVLQTVKHPEKVMVFGAISPSSKSKLVFIDGKVNAEKYQQILKEGKIRSFMKNHSHRSPLFMEDGAPGHRAASTKTWHAKNGINLLPDWPGNSPDLNPIENLWSEMKNRLRDERPTSKAGIKKVCQKVWKNIGVDYLEKLYESMPRRIQAVIDAEGGHTKY